ncbi:HlyD family secretion protein [Flavobacterium xanthum]|uniref:HlyD family secretion protein n=1 Tax=Flavobacterium xanthum TaxID=69322 RepID=A0A1M7LGK6_9FLAO|nr:hypothetical protein [Flavobacterium xanthum]SHM77173.1 hypothetical protein SAMN05443669_10717 [Flavobacterium xanthum]
MEELNDGLKIYSEQVRDVLSDPPLAILRWGNTLLLGFVIILLLLSWFIKYPDIVSTEIVITTTVPPEKLVARTSGKIETLLVDDKGTVQENSPLAIIQNTANYKDVFLLKSIIEDYSQGNKFDFEKLKDAQLGDIESTYALFHAAYIANKLNSDLQPFIMEGKAQRSENLQIRERLSLLLQQKIINESELQLQKNEVDRYETLFNKGVISAQDFDNKKLGYLQAQKSYKNLLNSISQLKSSLIDNNKNSKGIIINGTKEEVNLESSKMQSFYQLKKVIKDWELAYVILCCSPKNVQLFV